MDHKTLQLSLISASDFSMYNPDACSKDLICTKLGKKYSAVKGRTNTPLKELILRIWKSSFRLIWFFRKSKCSTYLPSSKAQDLRKICSSLKAFSWMQSISSFSLLQYSRISKHSPRNTEVDSLVSLQEYLALVSFDEVVFVQHPSHMRTNILLEELLTCDHINSCIVEGVSLLLGGLLVFDDWSDSNESGQRRGGCSHLLVLGYLVDRSFVNDIADVVLEVLFVHVYLESSGDYFVVGGVCGVEEVLAVGDVRRRLFDPRVGVLLLRGYRNSQANHGLTRGEQSE